MCHETSCLLQTTWTTAKSGRMKTTDLKLMPTLQRQVLQNGHQLLIFTSVRCDFVLLVFLFQGFDWQGKRLRLPGGMDQPRTEQLNGMAQELDEIESALTLAMARTDAERAYTGGHRQQPDAVAAPSAAAARSAAASVSGAGGGQAQAKLLPIQVACTCLAHSRAVHDRVSFAVITPAGGACETYSAFLFSKRIAPSYSVAHGTQQQRKAVKALLKSVK